MVKRITQTDIININTIYAECKNKAETARRCGISASTVTKYIIPNFILTQPIKSNIQVEEVDINLFNCNWADLIILSIEEEQDMEVLRKEVRL